MTETRWRCLLRWLGNPFFNVDQLDDAATMLNNQIDEGENQLEERFKQAPDSFPHPLSPRPSGDDAEPAPFRVRFDANMNVDRSFACGT